MSNKLVPRLRFKEFNNQWLNKNLNNFSNIIMGQSPLSKNYTDDDSSYLLIQGNADLKEGKIFPRLYTTQVTKITRKNDIILTVRAPVGEVAINNYGNAVIGRGVSSITGNYFLYSMFNYFKLSNYWNKFSTGSTFDSIDSNTLKNVKINFPSLSEQQKIGQFFSKLDRLIDLQSQKLSHLKQLKKGYLQKMFPQKGESVPRLRFDGFRDDWNTTQIKKISNIKTGKSKYHKNKINRLYPILGSTNIIGYDSSYDYKGDFILISRVGDAGKLYKYNGCAKITDNTIFLQFPRTEFLLELLKTKKLDRLSFGSGRKLIKSSEIKNVRLNIPDDNEQKNINLFSDTINNLINLQYKKNIELKKLKKAYLQKMFV